MDNFKIFLIDSPTDLNLFNELLTNLHISANIQSFTSVTTAIEAVELDAPDIILVGSGIVINEGLEFLRPKAIPIVVLCESFGLDRFLNGSTDNICFITRPLDIDRIPEMIDKAYEFMISFMKG